MSMVRDYPVMTSSPRFSTPGGLFANIPGILGFYPHDSVVFLAFSPRKPDGYILGPTLRIDCALLHSDHGRETCESIMDHLDEISVEMVIALVLSRDAALRNKTSKKLSDLRQELTNCHKIEACFETTEICTEEPFWLAWTASEIIAPSEWGSGRMSSVVAAPSMAALIKEGTLPELDRDSAYQFFDYGNPFWDDGDLVEIQNEVREHYYNKVKILESGVDVEVASALKRKYSRQIRKYGDFVQQFTAEDIMSRRDLLVDGASFMSSVMSRDAFLNFAVERGSEAMKIMIAVARSFEGTIRANALCCYAVGALAVGLGMRIQPAVAAALMEEPEHNLARLILEAACYGQYQHILEAAGNKG
ncbi:DUF4192 family protein [Corynebacterium poyangense]|uniref:DUF4192 family protein n=1 Tax=Corynebacterium poyangense TaxID=2684405 RepID=A0A7H0SP93_9CORY|nr:DUF4192 domain-containing protein [Corynebacterium poyangense]QNQ90368.1 DUF4192 family protein [Corynebacterium poyangense]